MWIVVILLSILAGFTAAANVRLSRGWEGRVEVFYSNRWGTICDDFWDNMDCIVVCKDLGYTGGLRVENAATHFGQGQDPIWLDDVYCSGMETSFDQCRHAPWGNHNCRHHEDAGCQCDNPSNTAPITGTCDDTRHRLHEIDSVALPGVGRVEIQHLNGQWYGVCDDGWGDTEAHVFCSCLGYNTSSQFRAYWSQQALSLPELDLIYDSVQCSSADINSGRNLWDCATTPGIGQCTLAEAALVECQAPPIYQPPSEPNVVLNCDGHKLDVCFTSDEYSLNTDYLGVIPNCAQTTTRDIHEGICINVDMDICQAPHTQHDAGTAGYCYDITYSEFDSSRATLLTDQVWTRRACCHVTKNGTVSTAFEPLGSIHTSVSTDSVTQFQLECFTDSSFNGATPLTYPAQLTRGSEVFCRVSADTSNTHMQLIVPECRFHALPTTGPSLTFHSDKCPTTSNLGMEYFSLGTNTWGFKFLLPKFQNHNQVYLSCNSYICDSTHESKPYCDQTCINPNSITNRKRRSVPSEEHRDSSLDDFYRSIKHQNMQQEHHSRRRPYLEFPKNESHFHQRRHSGGRIEDRHHRKSVIRRDVSQIRGKSAEEVPLNGLFVVKDHGFGPLITVDGKVELILPRNSITRNKSRQHDEKKGQKHEKIIETMAITEPKLENEKIPTSSAVSRIKTSVIVLMLCLTLNFVSN